MILIGDKISVPFFFGIMVCIKSCLMATMLLTSMIISTVAGIFIPIQNRLQLRSDQKQIYMILLHDLKNIFNWINF